MLRPLLLIAVLAGCAAPSATRGASRPAAGPDVDLVVDGALEADDPAAGRFRTVEAAVAAAPAGTPGDPTVIGIRPGVYRLPGTPTTPGLEVRTDHLTLVGLTDDRRTVVLADDRGLRQGAEDNGYVLDVDADGFTLRDLTLINHCNRGYDYPGDPSLDLEKRSDVITQAVALVARGDRHVYENVAILGRLDTMFLLADRAYLRDVYVEGTDDWVGGGGVAVWEDCTLALPTGSGVLLAMNGVFRRCRFVSEGGMEFYKVEFGSHLRPSALLESVVPTGTAGARVAWMREPAPPRPTRYSRTWRVTDADGAPTRIADSQVGPPTFAHSREIEAPELRALNPWNLLRAAPGEAPDDWDPAGARERYEADGALVYRLRLVDPAAERDAERSLFAAPDDGVHVRTGEPGVTIGAEVTPAYADDPTVTWETPSDLVVLSRAAGPSVVVTGRNEGEEAAWVPVHARASTGVLATAWVRVEPSRLDPPEVVEAPVVAAPAGGRVGLEYALGLDGRADRSLVTWAVCPTPACAERRVVAVSRGGEPARSLRLTAGHVGRYVEARLEPRTARSEPGPAVRAVASRPVEAADVAGTAVSPDFRTFPVASDSTVEAGLWAVGANWRVEEADDLGWGVHADGWARMLYPRGVPTGDMRVELDLRPDKRAGQVFSVPGSPADEGPNNLHADVYVKYDPATETGTALRFWRTTRSAEAVVFQVYRIEGGVGTPLTDEQVLSGVMKRDTRLTLDVAGGVLTVTASNTQDGETLRLEAPLPPSEHGGAGMAWPRGTAALVTRFEITYP